MTLNAYDELNYRMKVIDWKRLSVNYCCTFLDACNLFSPLSLFTSQTIWAMDVWATDRLTPAQPNLSLAFYPCCPDVCCSNAVSSRRPHAFSPTLMQSAYGRCSYRLGPAGVSTLSHRYLPSSNHADGSCGGAVCALVCLCVGLFPARYLKNRCS